MKSKIFSLFNQLLQERVMEVSPWSGREQKCRWDSKF